MERLGTVLWHCFVASLGDGLILLLIFAVGWIAFHEPNWFRQPGVSGYLLMLAAGLGIGVAVEWIGVHIAQRWKYTELMPIVPGFGVGVVPVTQMIVLPPLIFRIVALSEKLANRTA
jgi:hypothetical protein